MKKLLLAVSIILIVACVLFLIFALFNLLSHHSLRDGTAEHYDRLRQRAVVNFIISALLALFSAVCFIVRSKL